MFLLLYFYKVKATLSTSHTRLWQNSYLPYLFLISSYLSLDINIYFLFCCNLLTTQVCWQCKDICEQSGDKANFTKTAAAHQLC